MCGEESAGHAGKSNSDVEPKIDAHNRGEIDTPHLELWQDVVGDARLMEHDTNAAHGAEVDEQVDSCQSYTNPRQLQPEQDATEVKTLLHPEAVDSPVEFRNSQIHDQARVLSKNHEVFESVDHCHDDNRPFHSVVSRKSQKLFRQASRQKDTVATYVVETNRSPQASQNNDSVRRQQLRSLTSESHAANHLEHKRRYGRYHGDLPHVWKAEIRRNAVSRRFRNGLVTHCDSHESHESERMSPLDRLEDHVPRLVD